MNLARQIDQVALEEMCLDVLSQKGLMQFSDINIKLEPIPAPTLILANMDFSNSRRINFTMSPMAPVVLAEMKEQYALTESVNELINTMVYYIITHETGHHDTCPGASENWDSLLEGIYESVEGKYFRSRTINKETMRINNSFTDTVLNTVKAYTDEDPERYKLGHCLSKLSNLKLIREAQKKWFFKRLKDDPRFILFLDSNMRLQNYSGVSYDLMSKEFTRAIKGYQRDLNGIVNTFMGPHEDIVERVLDRRMFERDSGEIVSEMLRTPAWKRKAKEYAKIMLKHKPLSEEDWANPGGEDENEGQCDSDGDSDSDSSSGGSLQEQDDSDDSSEGQDNSQYVLSGSSSKDSAQDKKKSPIEQALDRMLDNARRERKRILGIPEEGDALEYLDQKYRALAQKLHIHTDEKTDSIDQYLSNEELDGSNFTTRNLDWSATRIMDGKVHIYRRDLAMEIPLSKGGDENSSLPDLCFILDDSISMMWSTGCEEGNYHLACIGAYSVLKLVDDLNLKSILNYAVIRFSDRTVSSGWQDYTNQREVRQTIVDFKEGGATKLGVEALIDIYDTRKDNFLAIMLTDGALQNTSEVCRAIKSLYARGGMDFVLFNIGGETSFSRKIGEIGLPVHEIESAADFIGRSLDLTQKRYGRAITA